MGSPLSQIATGIFDYRTFSPGWLGFDFGNFFEKQPISPGSAFESEIALIVCDSCCYFLVKISKAPEGAGYHPLARAALVAPTHGLQTAFLHPRSKATTPAEAPLLAKAAEIKGSAGGGRYPIRTGIRAAGSSTMTT